MNELQLGLQKRRTAASDELIDIARAERLLEGREKAMQEWAGKLSATVAGALSELQALDQMATAHREDGAALMASIRAYAERKDALKASAAVKARAIRSALNGAAAICPDGAGAGAHYSQAARVEVSQAAALFDLSGEPDELIRWPSKDGRDLRDRGMARGTLARHV